MRLWCAIVIAGAFSIPFVVMSLVCWSFSREDLITSLKIGIPCYTCIIICVVGVLSISPDLRAEEGEIADEGEFPN
jgi:hypothetical protein